VLGAKLIGLAGSPCSARDLCPLSSASRTELGGDDTSGMGQPRKSGLLRMGRDTDQQLLNKGKPDPKQRAALTLIFCRNTPVVRLDNDARDGQPYTHAFRLAREKGSKISFSLSSRIPGPRSDTDSSANSSTREVWILDDARSDELLVSGHRRSISWWHRSRPRQARKLIAIAAGAIIVCEAEAVPETRMCAHYD
jgi:hypothetical protein